MREYRDGEFAGVTIVDYGLSLNVTNGTATVHYDGAQASYFDVLKDRRLVNGLTPVEIDAEQHQWLANQRPWVERQLTEGGK